MNRERSLFVLVLLTFLGMVGLYVGMYLAYQKYQTVNAQYEQGGVFGLLSSFTKK
jgi:hypothetical protein